MKTCSTCKIKKNVKYFIKNKSRKDGLSCYCKHCETEYMALYIESHKEKINEHKTKYRKTHRQQINNQEKKYQKTNKKARNKYLVEKRHSNIYFKLTENLRKRLWHALKGNSKSKHTLELIGCTIEHLKQHLEKQFQLDMSWENYGKWHMDHIRPCASFDLTKPSEQLKCFNYTNLQPLWAEENSRKKDNYNE